MIKIYNKKHILFLVVFILMVLILCLIIKNNNLIKNKKIKYGEIKTEAYKKTNKPKQNYSKEELKYINGELVDENKIVNSIDTYGNKYIDKGLVNEGITFSVPNGFIGKKIDDTYYIYPEKDNKKNFSLMFALRFSKNDTWKRKTPEEAKSLLMDSTKGKVRYLNPLINTPYYMTHINRGKARKMDESLINENCIDTVYSDPNDPTKILNLDTNLTYIPLINTNIEVTGISAKEQKPLRNAVLKELVSSIREYVLQPYTQKKLDVVYSSRDYSTKLSKEFNNVIASRQYIMANMSNDIFSRDYDMQLTIGKFQVDDCNIELADNRLIKPVYLSWFNFKDEGTLLSVISKDRKKYITFDNKNAILHNFKLRAENEANTNYMHVLNPCMLTMAVTRLDKKHIGYIALRHSIYNNDISEKIVWSLAKETTFK